MERALEIGRCPAITAAAPLGGYLVSLRFEDGLQGRVDLGPALWGPVFEPLLDPAVFASFTLEGGTLTWACGADFAPEYLYAAAGGKLPPELCGDAPCD